MIAPEAFLAFVAIAALLSYGLTGLGKVIIDRIRPEEPAWRDIGLRALSVVVGGLSGLAALTVIEQPWYVLVVVGLTAGSHATWLVQTVKDAVKLRLNR